MAKKTKSNLDFTFLNAENTDDWRNLLDLQVLLDSNTKKPMISQTTKQPYLYPLYRDDNDGRCKKLVVEFPPGICRRGIAKPPPMENEKITREPKYGLFQESDASDEAGKRFIEWIADFDTKMVQLILKFQDTFQLQTKFNNARGMSMENNVLSRFKWTRRSRNKDPEPNFIRFQLDYEETKQAEETAVPAFNFKTAFFKENDDEEAEETLVRAELDDLETIFERQCELVVLACPRIWCTDMFGLTWTATQVIIVSSSSAEEDTVCMASFSSRKRKTVEDEA